MAKEVGDVLRRMTWTRARMNKQHVGVRVHIAKARVSQPISYGGLALPDPNHQNVAIRLTWINRKFKVEYSDHGWFKVLRAWLHEVGRPPIVDHMSLGRYDWRRTAEAMKIKSEFWSWFFYAVFRLQELAAVQMPEWHMFPIIGECEGGQVITRASLEYENPHARLVYRRGLRCIGQIFKTNAAGLIMPGEMKSLDEVRDEFLNLD